MVVFYFKSKSTEPFSHATEVQDSLYRAGHVSDQVRGLGCHDRSKICILPLLHSQGSMFFIICHIHNHTSIISSEMQVELKKNTAFTWGKWGEKNNTQTMLLGEYSVRTGKTPQQHKSTYTIDTRQSHRGSESGPASSHLIPQPLIRCWSDPLDQASGSKRTEVNGRGGGGQCL